MTSLILIVEDNINFLESTKLMLEGEGYLVISAHNGIEALEKIRDIEKPPDLIISDIKMPQMGGYEFFQKVQKDQRFNQIPFIFLTGLSSDKDIRLGRILGADDYLVKPIKEIDLLASVKGKLERKKRSEKILDYINNFEFNGQQIIASVKESEIEQIWILIFYWDDIIGPKLEKSYPQKEKNRLGETIEELGNQCFYAIKIIYGDQKKIENEEYLLFSLENVEKRAFIYFDAFPNPKSRSGEIKFMIGVIAPEITHYDSLQIRNYFESIAEKIKKGSNFDLKIYWKKICNILTSTQNE